MCSCVAALKEALYLDDASSCITAGRVDVFLNLLLVLFLFFNTVVMFY